MAMFSFNIIMFLIHFQVRRIQQVLVHLCTLHQSNWGAPITIQGKRILTRALLSSFSSRYYPQRLAVHLDTCD